MARKTIKREQQTTPKMPITFVAVEQDPVEQPISSGDTVAIESDATMTDGQVDEGHQTKRKHRKAGKSLQFSQATLYNV